MNEKLDTVKGLYGLTEKNKEILRFKLLPIVCCNRVDKRDDQYQIDIRKSKKGKQLERNFEICRNAMYKPSMSNTKKFIQDPVYAYFVYVALTDEKNTFVNDLINKDY